MTYVLDFLSYGFGYGQRSKFVMAEHSATAKGENCAYGPTLVSCPQVPVCGCRNLEKGSHFAKFIWSESMN